MGEVFKLNHCYNVDCVPAMELFPDNYFDLAVVDPPYFSGPERRGFYGSKVSKIGVHRDYPISPAWIRPGPEYFRELLRVSRHYIVWGCNYFDYKFATGRIVWDKCNGSSSFSDCEIAATDLFTSVRLFRYMWSGMMQGKSIVACHADKVVAAADSSYMVHPVSMGVCDYLTAEDLNNCLKALETIRSSIVTLYAKKSGKTEDECAKWMDETNWWTATEAKEKGFVDEVDDEADDSVVENRNGILFVNSICAAPMHWLSKSTLQSSGCTTGKSTRRKILYGRYMRAGPLEIRRPCA